jgi:NADPH:quinone reductase-like Zn-dependent oxidoreductase
MVNNCTVHAMTMSNLSTHRNMPTISSVLDRVFDLAAAGYLEAHVARTYGFDETAEAHRAVLEDSYVGKLVIVP